MATESTQPVKQLNEGEAAADLVEALDALAERARSRDVSAEEFLNELYRIDHDLQQRLGLTPTRRYLHLPNQGPEDESTPTQRLNLFWRNTRKDALNAKVAQLSEREFWAEFDDEVTWLDDDQADVERVAS